ncbi:hypothetical protein [Rhodococcus koreensis]
MQVTAAVSRGPESPFTLEKVELDEPRRDEVPVRIVARSVGFATLFAVDPVPARRALAAEFGAVAIDPGTQDSSRRSARGPAAAPPAPWTRRGSPPSSVRLRAITPVLVW